MSAAEEAHIQLLHISDPHFGDHDQDKLNALLDLVKQHPIDLACVTGDIVDSPWWSDYFEQAANFLADLKPLCNLNVFTVPGNHDAFGRSLSLARYKKHLKIEANFSKRLSIRGLDVCIFGIDTTSFSMRHANNSGAFSKKSKELLLSYIEKFRSDMGDYAFQRAVKICLVHHHPMPTGSSRLEGMLYFKNSGEFLKIIGIEGIDLVLHGHQHDPHYYRMDYNIGIDTESLIVLSAGTISKKIDEQGLLSDRAQFYIVKIYQSRKMEIESYNYYNVDKKFENCRYIETRPKQKNIITSRRDAVEYKLLKNGDMEVCERRIFSAEKGEKVQDLHIGMGVDDKGRECIDDQSLGLKVYREDQEIEATNIEWLESGPREKRIHVKFSQAIELEPVEVRWTYTWPGGFQELLEDGRGSGTYLIVDRTESLTLEFVSDANHIKEFGVVYYDDSLVKHLHVGNTTRRGFQIQKPSRTQIVQFYVRL